MRTDEERRAYQRMNMRKWRAANKERLLAEDRADRAARPELHKERHRRSHAQLQADPVRLEKKRAQARESMRCYRLSNPERVRDIKLKSNYGLTPGGYAELLAAQGGLCKICKTCKPRGRGAFNVDHCHATGRVRGLLCNACNLGLGMFKDSPELLTAALAYLKVS
jgi:hypothetical protein